MTTISGNPNPKSPRRTLASPRFPLQHVRFATSNLPRRCAERARALPRAPSAFAPPIVVVVVIIVIISNAIPLHRSSLSWAIESRVSPFDARARARRASTNARSRARARVVDDVAIQKAQSTRARPGLRSTNRDSESSTHSGPGTPIDESRLRKLNTRGARHSRARAFANARSMVRRAKGRTNAARADERARTKRERGRR